MKNHSLKNILNERILQFHESNCLICRTTTQALLTAYKSEVLPAAPSDALLDEILDVNAHRGFPGCAGSLDCTHVRWRTPKALQALHVNKSGETSVVIQAVAQHNLLCTSLFVGTPGITVMPYIPL